MCEREDLIGFSIEAIHHNFRDHPTIINSALSYIKLITRSYLVLLLVLLHSGDY